MSGRRDESTRIPDGRHSAMAGGARGGDARSSNGSNGGPDLLVDQVGGRDVQVRMQNRFTVPAIDVVGTGVPRS